MEAFGKVGYFPENLHTGEDLYMWMAIAEHYNVCVTPNILMSYEYQESTFNDRLEKNIYIQGDLFKKLCKCQNTYLNEIIARLVITDAIFQALRNNKDVSKSVEKKFNYTKFNRTELLYLRILNRTPAWSNKIIRNGWKLGSAIKTYLLGVMGR